VPEAIADLKKAATLFPLSSDIHRELGFSYYQQHEYKLAEAQYQTVQSINPNDLAAHYILGIVYSRLGNRAEAAKQEKLFADQKLDPMADIGMQSYYAKHPAIADEAVPWHVHTEAEAMQSWNSPTPSAKTAPPATVAKGGAR